MIHESQRTFTALQARLVDLLQTIPAQHSVAPVLQPYRDLGSVARLGNELVSSLLPRLLQRLNFVSPRDFTVEEPPPRGQIDWGRTLNAMLAEPEHDAALRLVTRQRRRDFATPENVLAIAAVLEYRGELLRLLQHESFGPHVAPLRHPLATIAEHCLLALASPLLAGIRSEAERVLGAGGLNQLVTTVQAQPSSRDTAATAIADWRDQWRSLQLMQRGRATPIHTLDANPLEADKLYAFWLSYELREMLQAHQVEDDSAATGLTFHWGTGDTVKTYVLSEAIPVRSEARNANFSYMSLQITPTDRREIKAGEAVAWQDPGFLIASTWFSPVGTATLAQTALKGLAADLHHRGERHAALLCACGESPDTDTIELPPGPGGYASLGPLQITLHRVTPTADAQANDVRKGLKTLLDHVHATLSPRVPLQCHGIWLDGDTVNDARSMSRPRILCPKPHIGPGVFALVDPDHDCLVNPWRCHVVGQAVVRPMVLRPSSAEDVAAQAGDVRQRGDDALSVAEQQGDEERAEAIRSHIMLTIGRAVEQYVQIRGHARAVEDKLHWIFQDYWASDDQPRRLAPETRRMLIAGEYVWTEFQGTDAGDWASTAVQFVRAVEHEIFRRLYAPCGQPSSLLDKFGKKPLRMRDFTFGTVSTAFDRRPQDHNWKQLLVYAAHASGADDTTFEIVIEQIAALRELRNRCAHKEPIDQMKATSARSAVIGTPGRPGILVHLAALLIPVDLPSALSHS